MSNFIAVSASVYTVLITPDSDGEITLDVDENLAQDVATNGNEAAQFIIEYDITQPTVDISTAASDPTNGHLQQIFYLVKMLQVLTCQILLL